MNSTSLDQVGILRGLGTRCFGRWLTILDECSSTNDVAARIAEDGAPHGAVVIAETQRAGRGRLGRAWYSPRGGVWMSVLIRPHDCLFPWESLPLVGALGIAEMLDVRWRVKAAVKWPNDVVVDGRKIAGTLVESKFKGNDLSYATLGLGINANVDTSAVGSIRDSSTSLLTLLGTPIDREKLIIALLSRLETIYESMQAAGESAALSLLADVNWSRGKHVRVRMVDRDLVGCFDGYESLARVRIRTVGGFECVETSAVVSVDYESD